MFTLTPKVALSDTDNTTTTTTTNPKPKHRRHSLLALVKSAKAKPKTTKPQYPPAINISTDNPPEYTTLYSPKHTSTPPQSPSLHSPTRSRSRKTAHLRRPSQPWTPAPNAPTRTTTSDTLEDVCPYSSLYPVASTGDKARRPRVVVSGSPPREGPLCPYSTFYPATDDMRLFSPFENAPMGMTSSAEEKVERKGRRISTGNVWEKIGERRAREGARRWG